LSASVVQLPEGQDADGLLRGQGASTVEGLIASARHWLEWRLDRLLAPLAAETASPSLEILQAVEQTGQALIEQLPDGVLRRSAEQRLNTALMGQSDQTAATPAKPESVAALIEPCAATARQRAEHRALRLFIHASECRELLQCLALQDLACRLALEWLSSLALMAVDGSIASMVLQLVGELPGAVGGAIAQAVDPGPDVVALLQRDPQAELQALLDLLEPVPMAATEPMMDLPPVARSSSAPPSEPPIASGCSERCRTSRALQLRPSVVCRLRQPGVQEQGGEDLCAQPWHLPAGGQRPQRLPLPER
jgi:hypothetical protein